MTTPHDPSEPSSGQPPAGGQAPVPCTSCGAETHEDVVKAAFWGRQGLIAIEDIPARVCPCCGEQLYDDRTAERIEGLVNGPAAEPIRQITVPVFSLAPPGRPPDVQPESR